MKFFHSLTPSKPDDLGNDMYLEYGNQNIWDLKLLGDVNNECGMIKWTNTFSFYDLWNQCYDSSGQPSYTLVETTTQILVNLNFYLTVVSPNPIYLTQCKELSKN